MYESTDKMVSHPDHYQAENGMEVINVIEAFTAGLTGVEAYDAGNIIKYACRWSKKNGIQDLEKIIWYATHLIEHLKNKKREERETYLRNNSLSSHDVRRKFIKLSLANKLDEKYKYDVTKIINFSMKSILNDKNEIVYEMELYFGDDEDGDVDYRVIFDYVNDHDFDVIPLYYVEEDECDEDEDMNTDDSFGYHYLVARFHMLLNAGKIFSNIVDSNRTYTITLHPERLNTIVLAAGHSIPDEYFTYNGVNDWSFEGGYEYKEEVDYMEYYKPGEDEDECYGTIDDEEGIKAIYTRQQIYNRFVELVKEGKMLTEAALNEIHSYRDVEGVLNMIDIIGKDEDLIYTFYMIDYDHYALYDEGEDVIVSTLE